jgi:Nuclease-related domain
MVSYPRRQQLRRLRHAVARALGAAFVLGVALRFAWTGQAPLAFAAVLLAVVLSFDGAHALRLAARSRVGAESEAQVRRTLEPLTRDGWHVQHAVDWPDGGDLDHVVRTSFGVGFVIETKTRRYTRAHLERTADAARRLARRRRLYPRGVRPVICLTRARGIARVEATVLVVSTDLLMPTLRGAAATASAAEKTSDGYAPSARGRAVFG